MNLRQVSNLISVSGALVLLAFSQVGLAGGYNAEESGSSLESMEGNPDNYVGILNDDGRDFGQTGSFHSITTINHYAFRPFSSTVDYTHHFTFGLSSSSGSDSWFYTALDRGHIPNGAKIRQVLWAVADNSDTLAVRGRLHRHYVQSGSGENPRVDTLVDVNSGTGDSGRGEIWENTDIDVFYRFDADENGSKDNVSYALSVQLPEDGTAHRLHSVRILWERQRSPAPATATFDDVPTTHTFFRPVESMVRSGITVGCGGNNYCPDDFVTRAQMATFLQRALGLHWGWNSVD